MIPIRYFVILTLKLISCFVLVAGIVSSFAMTYSYLGGSRDDRVEMESAIRHALHLTERPVVGR